MSVQTALIVFAAILGSSALAQAVLANWSRIKRAARYWRNP